jgi:ATP-dependent DNA ligase
MEATLRPMLADSIALEQLPQYIKDDKWVAQYKADGHRLLIKVLDGVVTAVGRSGQAKVSGLSHKLLGQFEAFSTGYWVFDGELIGSHLVLFDLVCAGKLAGTYTPFIDRYETLRTLYNDVWKPDEKIIGLLPIAVGATDKLALVRSAQLEQREGIMFRHVDGHYKSGGRSAHLLKAKFIRDVDCIITAVGVDGHDNVELSLLDPDNDRVVVVGRASAIGKKPKPEVMQVWSVTYLYCVDRGSPRLYQPRLTVLRDDKGPSECLFNQLDGSFTDKDLTEKTRAQM